MKRSLPWFVIACALGLASAFETRLAVFALLVLVIALAALTRLQHPRKSWLLGALCLSLLACSFGLYRFILREALPGIIEAHGRASGGRAVSFLRELSTAQDAMRRMASIDPDADHIGSAASLAELAGAPSRRLPKGLDTPPLALRYAPRTSTANGPVSEESGYYYLMCLPLAGGGLGGRGTEQVDDELAERRFVAYAWPVDAKQPSWTAYFIDEHENILESDNREQDRPRLVGREHPP
ncbi:MAG TPA: hypothetical protein VLC09_17925, partial [Polyangiaceae bacterium]|nr:hypothetical protein [Polyangiaceae bacterium]